MEAALLGTGDVTGVSVPFCECEYCEGSDRRRWSGLLVETDSETILLDVSPDLREQLRQTGVRDLDAAFFTHHHTDHAGGLEDLAPALSVRAFPVYVTETARGHFGAVVPYLTEHLPTERLTHGEAVSVGDC